MPSGTVQYGSTGCFLPLLQPVLALTFQRQLELQRGSEHCQQSYVSLQGTLPLVMKENISMGETSLFH